MVRVGTPSAVARPAWHDRNPVSKLDGGDWVGVTPHALTERVSYTVPAGKKAIIEGTIIKVRRATAATTPLRAAAEWALTPAGGAQVRFYFVEIFGNTVGDQDLLFLPMTMVLCSGDKWAGLTVDGSTAGTCDYKFRFKVTEFDA